MLDPSSVHLISTLTHAEVAAVLSRMVQRQFITRQVANAALDLLDDGPWLPTAVLPRRDLVRTVSRRHQIRGADLWHVAAALTLQAELGPEFGEVLMTSFDTELIAAASAEGIAVAP
jgi:predicted nucleic acid-binding protein